MTQNTLYWHDYETFGLDPARDRPVQFAVIRTDEELNIIGEPLNIMARPAPDTRLEFSPPEQIAIAVFFLILLPLGLLGSGLRIWLRRRKR